MSFDVTTLSMTEIIRLQDVLSRELRRRFERKLALVFSDIVESTSYFARYGDQAGRALQQRHVDMLGPVTTPDREGRIVDTAGDGAFLCFPSMDAAARAMLDFKLRLAADNADRPRDEQLAVRIGIHFGPALTDGQQVTGESVNLAARVAGSSQAGEIRITRDAFHALHDPAIRSACAPLHTIELKGVPQPVEVMRLEWIDPQKFPDRVRIEGHKEIALPPLDTITFGRVPEGPGVQGNDVVLDFGDDQLTRQVSRWHFELRRKAEGLVLRQLSEKTTEVDGVAVSRGGEAPIRCGSVVRIAGRITLTFDASKSRGSGAEHMATLSLD